MTYQSCLSHIVKKMLNALRTGTTYETLAVQPLLLN